ncbi:uncharacterized protein YALI1_A13392g [Yarrowia lipolytica]|uniref:Uncharacterized protein n=1 Tax=Yarrowia lipolytica TaxID=4952 RepID=A0A1D8N4M1_YARLL|nr:hypothetical protein YALI1_A13392g [Yarrowia lipolytica]
MPPAVTVLISMGLGAHVSPINCGSILQDSRGPTRSCLVARSSAVGVLRGINDRLKGCQGRLQASWTKGGIY